MSQASLASSGLTGLRDVADVLAHAEVPRVIERAGQPSLTGACEPANPQLQPQVVPAETPARVLRRSWPDIGVLVEPTDDGLDYWRLCDRHQWADGPFHALPVPLCPLCTADIRPGQRKYWALHQPDVVIR